MFRVSDSPRLASPSTHPSNAQGEVQFNPPNKSPHLEKSRRPSTSAETESGLCVRVSAVENRGSPRCFFFLVIIFLFKSTRRENERVKSEIWCADAQRRGGNRADEEVWELRKRKVLREAEHVLHAPIISSRVVGGLGLVRRSHFLSLCISRNLSSTSHQRRTQTCDYSSSSVGFRSRFS